MKALHVYKFTFNNYFMMNRELNFSVARNNFGYVLICWVTLSLRVRYWGQVVEMNFCSINLISCWRFLVPRGGSRAAATSKMEHFVIIVNGFQSLTNMQLSHMQWRCTAHVLAYWDILLRVENLKSS